jgi:hypothetical protein
MSNSPIGVVEYMYKILRSYIKTLHKEKVRIAGLALNDLG